MDRIILFMLVLVVLVSSSTVIAGAYNDGFDAGQDAVDEMWKKDGSDCDSAWDLRKRAKRERKSLFKRRSNRRARSYNKGVRTGFDEMVTAYEKKCLDASPKECMYLAESAAETIVRQNVCKKPRREPLARRGRRSRRESKPRKADPPPNYVESCRQVAINNCPGKIGETINKWCPAEKSGMGNTKLLELENKCSDAVNDLLG